MGVQHVLIVMDVAVILTFGMLKVPCWRMLMNLRVFNIVPVWPYIFIAFLIIRSGN